MAYQITFTSTVPNPEVLHWSQTNLGAAGSRKLHDLLRENRDDVISWLSEKEGNTTTLKIVFTNKDIYYLMYNQIEEAYPGYSLAKAEYIAENGIIASLDEVIL